MIELPQPSARLRAMCHEKFGLEGAQAAVLACPPEMLRGVQQEIVRAAPNLPDTPLGGPFALDASAVHGSYLMDLSASVTQETVDDWIRLCQALGVTQLDFHAGLSLRFGDYEPNPELYPDGLASLRQVTDRLREAGILAGLHTYAMFIAKETPWVSPVPHPDLDYNRTYTLAAPLTADARELSVLESIDDLDLETGFFSDNSLTLRIGDELIVYEGLRKEPPYGFASLHRGAHGTVAADHPQGAPVRRLKQMFFLLSPKPDSDLLRQVVERTAYVYNEGGFSMMYHDALDGAYMLDGPENAWYHGSKFIFDVMELLDRPPVMEMSTFHHHLWYTRSRMGAWDVAKRSYKQFVDMHVVTNAETMRYFLPSHLGWWGVFPWSAQDYARTFPDDIEYLCGKALAHNSSLSWLMGFNKDTYFQSHNMQRLGRIIRDYEELRLAGAAPEHIRALLGEPGAEFTLLPAEPDGTRAIAPI